MNETIKTRWVEALRSGKYSQSTGGLKDSRGYCCLGVLCDLYVGEHPEAHWSRDPEVLGSNVSFFATSSPDEIGESETLPGPVQEWAGLRTDDPEVCVAFAEGV